VVFLYNLSKDMDEEVSVSDIKGVNGDILVPALPADPKWLLDAMKGNAVLNNLLENAMVKAVKEERRLLYVGLTRARDMVFTVGFGKTMPWLQQCCPSAAGKDYSKVGNGECDIWGVEMNSCCYQCTPDPVKYNFANSKPARIKDAGFALPEAVASVSYAEKCHNPSKYNDKGLIAATSPEVVKEFSRIKISHSGVEDNVFGDCIHHIYALGSHPDKNKRHAAAERTLKAYGLDATNASAILDRFDDLCGYLRKYGDPERGVEHELPFVYQDTDGRMFSGTMDMVWKTKDACVVVDYKTFSGKPEEALKKSAEEYGSQMAIYRSAMEAAGEKVPAVLILYPVIGLIVKVN
jgi:ATP-dependent exoDNAse (exonuclease V) beta subunit